MRSLTRRALLRSGALGAAAATVAGCAGEEPGPAPAPPPDPETVLLRRLIEEKERTVALYAALSSRRLAPFRQRHEAHLAELRRRLPGGNAPGSAAISPAPSPSAAATPSPSPAPSLRRLRDLEREAAARRPRQTEGVSPALAQLIACIGACEAAHAVALPRSL
ncbi:hypothetical protein [Planomonospora sp. ID82291]|uniref:hypothetical protein n=1 Tax=Planomonospora sp. ID82291 TaxID=2738136 RepID=UPI001E307738|nr:hypothetical protein [Planomonospora sp. ID82291]